MEDFSQSRGDDDLFDDEIVPIEPTASSPPKITTQLNNLTLNSSHVPTSSPNPQPHNTSNVVQRGRGRDQGRGGSTRGNAKRGGGLSDSRFASPQSKQGPSNKKQSRESLPNTSIIEPEVAEEPSPQIPETSTEEAIETESPQSTVPTGPGSTTTTPQRPPAVRGDRTATGGVRKPKLTEEELTAKLAEAKERSQSLSAAHARAEADAAKFEERERAAKEKREKDMVERRVMTNEREKNRMRKMKGMEGREWDAEKNEDDFKTTGGRGRGRGSRQYGGFPSLQDNGDDDLKMYEWSEDRERGRGGRGRGRGRGRGQGRGGSFVNGNYGSGAIQQRNGPNATTETDFPALPASTKIEEPNSTKTTKTRPTPKRDISDIGSPAEGGGASWADQVESSEAGQA